MGAATISERYFKELPRLRGALRICEREIENAARFIDNSAVVSGRVKTHRSVLGKIYRKGKPRTWESVGDLVALKAVFPTERAVLQFTEWVSASADWHPKLEIKKSGPNELSYQSMQFDLWHERLVDTTGAPIKIELQVRTAVADAWYVVDHRLRYKGAVALPSDVERKLYRLIVLTELFDQEVEAVIAQQASLPEYAVARLYENLARELDELLGGYAKTSRPEGLLELVLLSYGDDEIADIERTATAFVAKHRQKIRDVVMDHLHDSADFVEGRDWLYYEPETLLIAERALARPALLAERIRGSDFELVITSMAAEFAGRLKD